MDAIQKIIDEGRPVEPYCFDIDNEETWYKIGVHDGYDYAIKETRKQMIDKACKWLKENVDDYGDYDLSLYFDSDQMIKGFRKAMEGQI